MRCTRLQLESPAVSFEFIILTPKLHKIYIILYVFGASHSQAIIIFRCGFKFKDANE